MTRTDHTKRIDPAQADSYAELGRRLLHAGRAAMERGDVAHASALAILSVHAGIAFADAAVIHVSGKKSSGSEHRAAVRLLRAAFGPRLPTGIETSLNRLLSEKDRFEYQGYLASMREASVAFAHAAKIATWTEGVLIGARRSAAG